MISQGGPIHKKLDFSEHKDILRESNGKNSRVIDPTMSRLSISIYKINLCSGQVLLPTIMP